MHEGAGGNKQCYLRPCLVKGDGCLLFQVLERQNRKLVGEGACASCRTRKRRKLEHPSLTTRHGCLTTNDAVKRLKKVTKEKKRLTDKLVCATRLLEKEKDSCFVEEDDGLQNLFTDAAQHVMDNEKTVVNTLLQIILQEHKKELSPNERNEKVIAPETVAECNKLAEELVTDITNHARKAANKST
jgi:hypothetical protein